MSELAKISIVALVLGLAGLGFFVFADDEGGGKLSPAEMQDEAEKLTEPETSPRRHEEPSLLDVALKGGESSKAPETGMLAAENEAATTRGLKIVLLIQDLDDKPVLCGSGSIELSWKSQRGPMSGKTISFHDNAASIAIPDGLAQLEVKSVVLGPEKRVLRISSRRIFSAEQLPAIELKIEAKIVPRVSLLVLDKKTKENLKDLRLYQTAWGFSGDRRPEQFRDRDLVQSGDSPLLVDVREHGTQSPYWIVADGYAAHSLCFAEKSEGERRIQLERGGGLEVEVHGDFESIDEVLRPDLRLRLFPETGESQAQGTLVFEQRCDAPGRLALENLLPGRYRIGVESGESWSPDLVLKAQEFRIEVGLTQSLRLDVDTSPLRLKLVEVKGRVIGIAGQDLSNRVVSIINLSRIDGRMTTKGFVVLRSVPGKPNEYHFEGLKLLPGSYLVYIMSQSFQFKVRETQTEDLLFELKAEDDLALKLRYVGSNDFLAEASVSWRGSGASGDARWDKERQCYLLSPKTGVVHLTVCLNTHMSECDFDYSEGQAAIELEIPKGQSYILILKCGDLLIPQEPFLHCSITNEEGARVMSWSSSSDGDRIERSLPAAGKYELEVIKPPKGYRSMGPVKFELKPGDRKELIYELVEVK